MMNKELKVYKGGKGLFTIAHAEDISGRHLKLTFEDKVDIELHDVIWQKDAMDRNLTNHMLVVKDMLEDGVVVMKTDEGFLSKEEIPQPGEKFTLIATFREIKDGKK